MTTPDPRFRGWDPHPHVFKTPERIYCARCGQSATAPVHHPSQQPVEEPER